jgi:hypothetical protein
MSGFDSDVSLLGSVMSKQGDQIMPASHLASVQVSSETQNREWKPYTDSFVSLLGSVDNGDVGNIQHPATGTVQEAAAASPVQDVHEASAHSGALADSSRAVQAVAIQDPLGLVPIPAGGASDEENFQNVDSLSLPGSPDVLPLASARLHSVEQPFRNDNNDQNQAGSVEVEAVVHNQDAGLSLDAQVPSSSGSDVVLTSPYSPEPVPQGITHSEDGNSAISASAGSNVDIITSPYLPEPAPQELPVSEGGQSTDKSLGANLASLGINMGLLSSPYLPEPFPDDNTASSSSNVDIITSPYLPEPAPQELPVSEGGQSTDKSLGANLASLGINMGLLSSPYLPEPLPDAHTASSSSNVDIITSPYLPEPAPPEISHQNSLSDTENARTSKQDTLDAQTGVPQTDAHSLATYGHETKDPASTDVKDTGEHQQELTQEHNGIFPHEKNDTSSVSTSAHEHSDPRSDDHTSTAHSADTDAAASAHGQRGAITDILTSSVDERQQNSGAESRENAQPVVHEVNQAHSSVTSSEGEVQMISVEGYVQGTVTHTQDTGGHAGPEAEQEEARASVHVAPDGHAEIPLCEATQVDERVLELIQGLESRSVMNRITCAAELGRLCEESRSDWSKETCRRVLTATVQLLHDGTSYAANLAETVAATIGAHADKSHLQSACACLCMLPQITRESAAELILTCCVAKRDENTAEYIICEITEMLETLFGAGSNGSTTAQDSHTDKLKARNHRRVQDKDDNKHAAGGASEDQRARGAERHSYNVDSVSLKHDVLCSCTAIVCRLCLVDGCTLGTAGQYLRCMHALLRPLDEEDMDEGAKSGCLYAIGHLALAYGRKFSDTHDAASECLPWGDHVLKCVCDSLQHDHPQIRKGAVYCLPKLYVCYAQQPAADVKTQVAPVSIHVTHEAGGGVHSKSSESRDRNIDSFNSNSSSSNSGSNKRRDGNIDDNSGVDRNKGTVQQSDGIGQDREGQNSSSSRTTDAASLISTGNGRNADSVPVSAVRLVTALLNDSDRTVRDTAVQSVLELSSFDVNCAMRIIDNHVKTCETAQRRASVIQSLGSMFRLADERGVDWRACGVPFIFREIEDRHASVRHAAQCVLSEMIKISDERGDLDECHTDMGTSQVNADKEHGNQERALEQDVDEEDVHDQEDEDQEGVVEEPLLPHRQRKKTRVFDDEAKAYVPLKTKRGEFLDELLWRSSEKDAMARNVSEAYIGVGALTCGITAFRGIERRGLGHTDPYVRENTVRAAQACAQGHDATEKLQSAIVQQVNADSECERRAGVDAWRMGGRIKAWMGEGRIVYERLGDRGLEKVLLELGDGGCDEGEKRVLVCMYVCV